MSVLGSGGGTVHVNPPAPVLWQSTTGRDDTRRNAKGGWLVSDPVMNFYSVLGTSSTATAAEVKQAYRRAARRTHPDQGGDAAEFRAVTLAWETLGDPAKRAAYDKSYGTTAGRQASGARTSPVFRAQSAASRSSTAAEPAIYHPTYADAGASAALPQAVAALQVHGAPRKRGLFGAQARLIREATTADMVIRKILPDIPSARLVNGLHSPHGNGYLDHVLVAGYRMVILGSMLLPDGAYRWNGSSLMHGAKVIEPPQLLPAVRGMQEVFPECNVTAWVALHSTSNNDFEPVVDYARGAQPDGTALVHVANRARLVREVKHFLAAGPTPNVVDVPVLARLLGGMY